MARGPLREQELGATSLRYHEGSHGRDIVEYVRTNPFPVFTGAVGDTADDFRQKLKDYVSARAVFDAGFKAAGETAGECPGTTIDQYMQNIDPKWTPICP